MLLVVIAKWSLQGLRKVTMLLTRHHFISIVLRLAKKINIIFFYYGSNLGKLEV